jgi:hypothetical protein
MKFKEFVCFNPARPPLSGPFLWHTPPLTREEMKTQQHRCVCSVVGARCSVCECQLPMRTYKGRKTSDTTQQGHIIQNLMKMSPTVAE